MLSTKHFLKQGLQVGPWKVTRKVLLFIVAFCLVILAFGTLMLETHAFDGDWDSDRDDDDSYEKDDDWDDDWELGGGDMAMIVIMCLAGASMLVSLLACCFAQVNPPSHLNSRNGGGQVFTIQLTKPSIGPQTSLNNQFYQYHQQQQQRHQQQYLQQVQQMNQGGNTTENAQEARGHGAAGSTASAPYTSRSPPPPYSPSLSASAAASPTSNNEKPPPYSP